MTPKDKATELFNHHYNIIFDQGYDLSQEIIISVLAKNHAHYTASMCLQSTENPWWDLVKQYIESM